MSLSIPCLHSHQTQHEFATCFPFQQQLRRFSSLSGPFLSIAASRDPVEQNPVHPSLGLGRNSDLFEPEKHPYGLLMIYIELRRWRKLCGD